MKIRCTFVEIRKSDKTGNNYAVFTAQNINHTMLVKITDFNEPQLTSLKKGDSFVIEARAVHYGDKDFIAFNI